MTQKPSKTRCWPVLRFGRRLLVVSDLYGYIYTKPSSWFFLGRTWELESVCPDNKVGGLRFLILTEHRGRPGPEYEGGRRHA